MILWITQFHSQFEAWLPMTGWSYDHTVQCGDLWKGLVLD